jgi:predicted nucleotide-binding protein
MRTEAIFGLGSRQVSELAPLVRELGTTPYPYHRKERAQPILALLKSFQTEIEELWSDEGIAETVELIGEGDKDEKVGVGPHSSDIFVVHGHDHGRMQAVTRFIEHLKLNPVILHERASKGSTIIEKLEKHANVAFAIILLTPDDVGSIATGQNNLLPRARQNVVLELGYFMGRLGRMRTCALVVEGVELPTDYSGVVYIQIDEKDAWKFELARELRAVGLSIDMNKVL